MLLVHADPATVTLSLTDADGEPLDLERRADGTFDVPHDLASGLLEWPTWTMAPPPVDPELGDDAQPSVLDYLPSLKDLRKHELQALCLERDLDNDGTNDVLKARLLEWAAARQTA